MTLSKTRFGLQVLLALEGFAFVGLLGQGLENIAHAPAGISAAFALIAVLYATR